MSVQSEGQAHPEGIVCAAGICRICDDRRKEAGEDVELARVMVTRPFVGVCHMQVCTVTDATDEEILEVCNRENPAGTSNGWASVYHTDDDYWGKTAPGPCADLPDRLHYLVGC